MFEWWSDLSKGARYGVSILFLGVSTLLYFCGYFWPWGWAVGGVLFLAAVVMD